MRISLLYPRWTDEYKGRASHFAKRAATYPPLNLAYIAAIAEQHGHEVRIIDAEAENKSDREVIEETASFKPDIIGLTSTTPFFHTVERLAEGLEAKLPNIPKVIGGQHITVLKEKAFSRHYKYGFIGEADNSWPEFLECFSRGKSISSVQGLLYRDGDEVRFTGKPPPVTDVDGIPFPSRHLLPMNKYFIGTMKGRKNFSPIMTIRGCPFKCIFCSTQVFGKSLRKRSPQKVVEEIKSVIDTYGITHFIFLDDTLTLDRKHFNEICDLILENKLNITFEGSTRANLVDESLVAKMAKAGMIRISFGLESVNEGIRKIMRKEVPLESYSEANRLTNKYGIETLNSCMIGLPGETRETIKETLKYLRKSREIKQANISIAVPYPGTELYEMAIGGQHGLKLLDDDFSHYRRYDAAVMQVGDLSPQDLMELQNDAFVSIYSAPWRWVPMIRKSGIRGAALTFGRVFKTFSKKFYADTNA